MKQLSLFNRKTGLFLLLLPIAIGISPQLHAQQTPPCQWALGAGSASPDAGSSVANYNGDVYVTGTFSGTNIDFDPGPGVANLSSTGGTDVFVAKYNASGQYQWAFSIGGAASDSGNAIAVDIYGYVYVTGAFGGSNVDFDPGGSTANLSSNGASDIFLAMYSPTGQYQWAIGIGGANADEGFGVATDDSTAVYITGSLGSSNVDFDPSGGTALRSTNGGKDIFVAKYLPSAQYAWAFNAGSTGNFNECGYDITWDRLFNVYVTGQLDGTGNVDMDPSISTHNLAGGGSTDIFVAKYNSNGLYQWSFELSGPNADFGSAVCTDDIGNICITGKFDGTIDFDPGSGTQQISSNGTDGFMACYSPSGVYRFAFPLGGSTNNDGGTGVSWDGAGNAFVTGYISGTADFDPGPATMNLQSNGMEDAYVAMYNNNGQLVWALNVGNSNGDDESHAVSVSYAGDVAITGAFTGTNTDFDPDAATVNLSSNGAADIFVAQYYSCWGVPPAPTDITGPLIVCNGGAYTYSVAPVAGATDYTWTLPPGWSGNSTSTSINVISSTMSGTISVVANNACGSSAPVTLTVTSAPPPTITYVQQPDTACFWTSPFTLSPASPVGGTYSGGGVSGNVFTPSVAGLGYDTIWYTYIDTSGCIGTQPQVIHVVNCVGIEVIPGEDLLHVFPNPFTDQLRLELSVRGEAQAIFYNAAGQQVKKQTLKNGVNLVDTQQLDPGLYLLEILTDEGVIQRRLIRQ